MKQAVILTKQEAEKLELMVKVLGRAVTDLNHLYYGKETVRSCWNSPWSSFPVPRILCGPS